jgi:hypothetical protein
LTTTTLDTEGRPTFDSPACKVNGIDSKSGLTQSRGLAIGNVGILNFGTGNKGLLNSGAVNTGILTSGVGKTGILNIHLA